MPANFMIKYLVGSDSDSRKRINGLSYFGSNWKLQREADMYPQTYSKDHCYHRDIQSADRSKRQIEELTLKRAGTNRAYAQHAR